MAKEVLALIKLEIPAGKATPAPPIGPALGQRGLNIMEFCKAFNADTQSIAPGTPVPVVITAFKDKTFTFIKKSAPVSYFLKQAAGLQKTSQEPGKKIVGKVTKAQIMEIAKQKIQDMNTTSLDAACRMIAGTATSMGLAVEQ